VLNVADLYASFSLHLKRIVELDVQAPEAVIEDACQFAWARLLLQRDVEQRAAPAWLARTAAREALNQLHRTRAETSLEEILEKSEGVLAQSEMDEAIEARDRLRILRRLPCRQQRLLWLHGFGFNYEEMATHERCTRRTIERQLLRGRRSLRSATAE
jgi:RNA polymerase sigma factor (sigma-70 family)